MQMTDERKQWLELAKRIAENPAAELPCPRCGREPVQVIDTPVDDAHVDRHLMCTFCDAYDIVRMPLR
jgi:hypothetical protein